MANTVFSAEKRIDWIDYARAIGMLLIVFGHTVEGGAAHQFVYAFHVPLFFFLAGTTFKRTDKFFEFIKKKTQRLLIPYWVVMLISIVIFYFLGSMAADALGVDTNEFSWWKYILGSLYANGKSGYLKANMPLWFLSCLFSVEFILFWVDRFICAGKRKHRALLCFFISVAFLIINNKFLHIANLPFGLETALSVFPFVLLGYGLKEKIYSVAKIPAGFSALIIAALTAVTVAGGCFFNTLVNVRRDSYGNVFIYFIVACCGIAAIYLLANMIPKCKLLSYISKNTMVILLLHKFPILFFQVVFPITKKYLANNNFIVSTAVSVVSMAMCLAAGIVIEKICPWLIGKQRKK